MQHLPFDWSIFEAPIDLYVGPSIATPSDGCSFPVDSRVQLVWRPTPKLSVDLRSNDPEFPGIGLVWDNDLTVRPTGLPPGVGEQSDEGTLSRISDWSRSHLGESGAGTRLHLLTALILNLDHLSFKQQRIVSEIDHWRVVIEDAAASHIHDLGRFGGYGITHLLRIERADGRTFTANAVEKLLTSLYHFLGFVNGRLAGFAIPMGWDKAGTARWCEWSVRHTDRWHSTLIWYDRSLSDDLPGLFASWHHRFNDLFWKNVLTRVSRLIAAANNPDPLDVAVVTAATGLDLLAWAVLRTEQWVSDDSGDITAAGMNRLLLSWAGIPAAIPTELAHLTKVARSRSLDGPAAVAWTRNRLVHPPQRRKDGWPSGDVLRDVWRLGLEYLELCTLRLLDYHGKYAHRRHMQGRWVGETTAVPWS